MNALEEARLAFAKHKSNPYMEIVDKSFPKMDTPPVAKTTDTKPIEKPKIESKPKVKEKVQKPERMKLIEKKSKSIASDAPLVEQKAKVQKQMQENTRKEEANLFLGSLPDSDEPIVRQLSYGFSADPEALPSHDLKIMVELIREASARLKTQDRSKVLRYIISEADKIGGDKRWRSLAVRWAM